MYEINDSGNAVWYENDEPNAKNLINIYQGGATNSLNSILWTNKIAGLFPR